MSIKKALEDLIKAWNKYHPHEKISKEFADYSHEAILDEIRDAFKDAFKD